MKYVDSRREFIKTSAKLAGAISLLSLSGTAFANTKGALPSITLANGLNMPSLGYGTFEQGKNEVLAAIKTGYRLLDTASRYKNEEQVGEAVRQSGVRREELFITTKIFEEKNVAYALDASLKRLGLSYVDLYLIHWPKDDKTNLARWKALEQLYKSGKTKAIGVCNFSPAQLQYIMKDSSIVPMINQIELHPFINQEETISFCKANNIAIEAYRPLGLGKVLNNATLQSLAKKYGKTPAQIMLRYSIQRGFIAIPRTKNPARMQENLNIFDFSLDSADMDMLTRLSEANS